MRVRPALAPQMGGHLGAQLGGSEGLADVVVGAEAVAGDGVLLGHLGGEEDDGAVKGGAGAADELEAVEVRHHDVAEQEVVAREVHPQHLGGVADAHDLVAVPSEHPRERVEDRPLVVHRQDARHHVPHPLVVLLVPP